MAAEVQPPELAALVDFAERSRVDDWCLRAALTRYAQPQPQRASDVLEPLRRIEFALKPQLAAVAGDGAALWDAVRSGDVGRSPLAGLLGAAAVLDGLGDVLAEWAADPDAHDRPDAAVDDAVADANRRLDELGVPREERQRPGPRGRPSR
jgi:hypothetical protein